jgi:hypothetical protein
MINNCPACDSIVTDAGTMGHCVTCGWEFVAFAAPFELGQKQMQTRLNIARNYLNQLREGTEEIKQEITQLRSNLQSTRESLEQKETEVITLHKKNEELKADLEQAISDQYLIAQHKNNSRYQISMHYWANKNGEIHIESKEPLSKPPTMLMIIKRGDVFVAPGFGSDGTYAAIIHPAHWQKVNQYNYMIKSNQILGLFPCLSGDYTFSLATALPSINLSRKGTETDISNIILKFN